MCLEVKVGAECKEHFVESLP